MSAISNDELTGTTREQPYMDGIHFVVSLEKEIEFVSQAVDSYDRVLALPETRKARPRRITSCHRQRTELTTRRLNITARS
jgi:hypothetical protein